MNYTVHGQDGNLVPRVDHTYEIGSITKAFTGLLLAKSILKKEIQLNAEVGPYLNIAGNTTPTFRELVTHTAGLRNYYDKWRMLMNAMTGKNPGYNISSEKLTHQLVNHLPASKNYAIKYSNFGLSIAGNAIAAKYQMKYYDLINHYLSNDLGLDHTHIVDNTGDLGNYWQWKKTDGYLPAGGLTSTISDMLRFLKMNIHDENPELTLSHQIVRKVSYQNQLFRQLNISIDAVGMAWLIDKHQDVIWHNGGTNHYNADIRFNKNEKIGVVVLSNLNYAKVIPATVLSAKILSELDWK